MIKSNVKKSIRTMPSGDEIVSTKPFTIDMDNEDVSVEEKLKQLEEQQNKLEQLETVETQLDNQYIDDQQDNTTIFSDDYQDTEVELLKDSIDLQRIKKSKNESLFFENDTDDMVKKDTKDDYDYQIEQKLKKLSSLKKKMQLLDLDREIEETEKQTQTPGFLGMLFKVKTEEELKREKSRLDRELSIAELESEINKKRELLKNSSRVSTARKVLSTLKSEFFDEPNKNKKSKQNDNKSTNNKKVKKESKQKSSLDGFEEFLFG